MKKKLLTSSAIILISTLTGCASTPSYEIEKFWKKDQVSYTQAKKEFIDCKETAKSTAERDTLVGGLTESCMTLKGYKWGVYKRRVR